VTGPGGANGAESGGLSFALGYGRREFRLDVELQVPVGVTALFGPSGSGKSTLLRCLAGLLRPTHGRIELGGRVLFSSVDRIDLPPESRRLGYVPQEGLLFPHLSLRRNIYYGLARDGDAAPAEARRRAEELIDLLGLRPLLDRRPAEVSYGEAQRAALLRALVIGPQALLMDEPLSALDRALKARALSDLREMKSRPSLRIPVLYVTHDAAEVLALADRVLLIHDGRIVGEGGPELAIHPPGGFAGGGADNLITGRLLPGPRGDAGFSVAWGAYRLKVSGQVPGAAEGLSPSGGERVTLAFGPTEAIVSLQPPGATSARNVLPAVIAAVVPAGGVALLRFDEPERFDVAVTADAREDLDLQPGRSVFLLIKSTSLRPVEIRRS
jgi:molybdate transport system ATP-binding protein